MFFAFLLVHDRIQEVGFYNLPIFGCSQLVLGGVLFTLLLENALLTCILKIFMLMFLGENHL